MAPRPIEKALSAELRDDQLRFMNIHGVVALSDIYQAVKGRYGRFCDDSYHCPHFGRVSTQPEWQHTVRSVLNSLKKNGIITKSVQRTKWIFP
jgi:hypothetical protein